MIAHCISGDGRFPGAREAARQGVKLTRYLLDASPIAIDLGAEVSVGYVLAHPQDTMSAQMHIGEKVLSFGARNLISKNSADWPTEMAARGLSATRCQTDPFMHLVISLRRDEKFPDVEALVDLLLLCLSDQRRKRKGPWDASKLALVWAVHGNTHYQHLHIYLSRIDPATGRPVQLASNWELDALQQFCALAADRFGLSPEKNAPYHVVDGFLVRKEDNRKGAAPGEMITYQRGDRKTLTQQKIANPTYDPVRAVIDNASSWLDLHDLLKPMGAVFRKAGSGARIRFESGNEIKASELGKSYSMSRLIGRWGEFVSAAFDPITAAYDAYKRACQLELARIQKLQKRFGGFKKTSAVYKETMTQMRSHPLSMFEWQKRKQPNGPNVKEPRLLLWEPAPSQPPQSSPKPNSSSTVGGVGIPDRPTVTTLRSETGAADEIARLLKRGGTVEPIGSADFIERINALATQSGFQVRDSVIMNLPPTAVHPAAVARTKSIAGDPKPVSASKLSRPSHARSAAEPPVTAPLSVQTSRAGLEAPQRDTVVSRAASAAQPTAPRSPTSIIEPSASAAPGQNARNPSDQLKTTASGPPIKSATVSSATVTARPEGKPGEKAPITAPVVTTAPANDDKSSGAFQPGRQAIADNPAPNEQVKAGADQRAAQSSKAVTEKALQAGAGHELKPGQAALPDSFAQTRPTSPEMNIERDISRRPSGPDEEYDVADLSADLELEKDAQSRKSHAATATPAPITSSQPASHEARQRKTDASDEARVRTPGQGDSVPHPTSNAAVTSQAAAQSQSDELEHLLASLRERGMLVKRDRVTKQLIPPQQAEGLWRAVPEPIAERVADAAWAAQQQEVDEVFDFLRQPEHRHLKLIDENRMIDLDVMKGFLTQRMRRLIERYECENQFQASMARFIEDRRNSAQPSRQMGTFQQNRGSLGL